MGIALCLNCAQSGRVPRSCSPATLAHDSPSDNAPSDLEVELTPS